MDTYIIDKGLLCLVKYSKLLIIKKVVEMDETYSLDLINLTLFISSFQQVAYNPAKLADEANLV